MTETAPIPTTVPASHAAPDRDGEAPPSADPPHTSQPQQPPQTTAKRIMTIAFATILVIGCAISGAYTTFSSLFVGATALHEPDDLRSLEQWASAIGAAALTTTEMVTYLALVLVAVACLTVFAAWRRNTLWLSTGMLSLAILTLSLLSTATNGNSQLASIITHTHTQIGAVKLVNPTDSAKDQPTASLPPALTVNEATAEIIRLVSLTAAHTGAPLTAIDPSTSAEHVFAPEAPPIQYESCFPDPQEEIGSQATLSFTTPSDPEGRIPSELTSIWAGAGYPPLHAERSQHVFGGPNTPIHSASINDRYTIDGQIHIQITSRCATTTSTPTPTPENW